MQIIFERSHEAVLCVKQEGLQDMSRSELREEYARMESIVEGFPTTLMEDKDLMLGAEDGEQIELVHATSASRMQRQRTPYHDLVTAVNTLSLRCRSRRQFC